jgi:CRP-like cAMP-binding protein
VAFLGPGLVLGFARIPDIGDLSVYDFSANDNVVAVHMPLQLVLDILEKYPKLWKDMAAMLMRQHRDQFDALVDHMAGPLQRRLAGTIDRLATLYGTRASREGPLRLRLTQENLSLLLQVTRQSVNKELKALAALGTIELEYNTIAVLDPAALKRLAQ